MGTSYRCRMQLAAPTVGAVLRCRRCSALRCARKTVVGREPVGGGVVPREVLKAGVGAERGRWRRPAVNGHRAPPVVLLMAAGKRDGCYQRYPRVLRSGAPGADKLATGAGPLRRAKGAPSVCIVPIMALARAADVQGHPRSLAALRGRGESVLTDPIHAGLLPFVPLADRRRVH